MEEQRACSFSWKDALQSCDKVFIRSISATSKGLFGRASASPKTAPALAPPVEWLF
jgi:hypothetical protein